jgi:hypothetical protein
MKIHRRKKKVSSLIIEICRKEEENKLSGSCCSIIIRYKDIGLFLIDRISNNNEDNQRRNICWPSINIKNILSFFIRLTLIFIQISNIKNSFLKIDLHLQFNQKNFTFKNQKLYLNDDYSLKKNKPFLSFNTFDKKRNFHWLEIIFI